MNNRRKTGLNRQLQLKPHEGYSGTAEVPGAPAPTGAAKTKKEKAAEKAERDRKGKEKKVKEKKKKDKEAAKAAALAATAPAGRPNPKGGPKPPPRPPTPGNTTREEVTKAAQMTPAEKAKTPCMFYAYGMCKAKSCAFLHSDTQKYKGPPQALKGKAPAKVAASVAPLVQPQSATHLVMFPK